jgi:hypothetical protein
VLTPVVLVLVDVKSQSLIQFLIREFNSALALQVEGAAVTVLGTGQLV